MDLPQLLAQIEKHDMEYVLEGKQGFYLLRTFTKDHKQTRAYLANSYDQLTQLVREGCNTW